MTSVSMKQDRASWRKLFCFLIAAAGFLAYSNTFSAPYIFDDHTTISDYYVGVFRHYESPWFYLMTQSRPLVKMLYAIQYQLMGLDVWSYHLVNLAVHLLAGLALFGVIRRTLLTKRLKERYGTVSDPLAFSIALVWVLHPLATQSVTYLSQRAEALTGLFSLLTFYSVIRGATGRKTRTWYFIAVLACSLGMLCKASMMVTPALILIYDRIFLSDSFRALARKRWGLYLGLVGSLILLSKRILFLAVHPDVFNEAVFSENKRRAILSKTAGFSNPYVSSLEYLKSQPGVVLHYLRLAFWPTSLCLDYLWPVATKLSQILPGAAAISALLVATLVAVARLPALGFLGVWFFVQLVPRSSFVPALDLAVEHRMYLPLIAIAAFTVIVGFEGALWLGKRGTLSTRHANYVSIGLAVTLACTLGLLTFRRNLDYQSRISIWQDTVDKRPNNATAHNNLGAALGNAGRFEEAISEFKKSIEINPNDRHARANVGAMIINIEAQNENPDYEKMYNNIGAVLAEQKRPRYGIPYLEKAIEMNPDHAKALYNMGVINARSGNFDTAVHYYGEAVKRDPDYVMAHNNLGAAYFSLKQFARAVEHYERAAELDPTSDEIQNNLRMALARQGEQLADA
jgi:protein O-mannosyl-transferase